MRTRWTSRASDEAHQGQIPLQAASALVDGGVIDGCGRAEVDIGLCAEAIVEICQVIEDQAAKASCI
jgi:hypothetical protein